MVEKEPHHDPEPQPRFALGQVVATPGALEAFAAAGQESLELLTRHVSDDWSDLEEQDRTKNEFSVANSLRILSAYTLKNGVKLSHCKTLLSHQVRLDR